MNANITEITKIALRNCVIHLEEAGFTFTPGLTSTELETIENDWHFRFPPDLRWFLTLVVPKGRRFTDWRGSRLQLAEAFAWPTEGICFDIRNSKYWRQDWGEHPNDDDQAIQIARTHLKDAPRLIPIHGHSYLPCEPYQEGNPVFSVYQTDIIHRGGDLPTFYYWLSHSADSDDGIELPEYSADYRYIHFWSDLARENFEGYS